MNEMRKLMESLDEIENQRDSVVENVDDPAETAAALREIYEQLVDSVSELENVIRGISDHHLRERGRRMVLAHLQTALNKDHNWMGGNMSTLEEFIREVEGAGNPDYEEEEDRRMRGY